MLWFVIFQFEKKNKIMKLLADINHFLSQHLQTEFEVKLKASDIASLYYSTEKK